MFSEEGTDFNVSGMRGHQPVQDRYNSDYWDDQDCFCKKEQYAKLPRYSHVPMARLRFPDYYGQREPEPSEQVMQAASRRMEEKPSRRENGTIRRFLPRTLSSAVILLFGLAVGLGGARYLVLEKVTSEPVTEPTGEYVVEEVTPNDFQLADQRSIPDIEKGHPVSVVKLQQEPSVSVAITQKELPVPTTTVKKEQARESVGGIEVLDTIASIPPWNPVGEIPPYSEQTSASQNLPAKPLETVKVPRSSRQPVDLSRDQNYPDTVTAVRSESLGKMPPVTTVDSAVDNVDSPVAQSNLVVENSTKPMKNQIEYFEPFDTASFAPQDDPMLRMTASENFYNDAYGIGSFSDYVPPRSEDPADVYAEPVLKNR